MNRNTSIGIILIVMGISLMTMVSRYRSKGENAGFAKEELEIMDKADSTMRVLTIDNADDLGILRSTSTKLNDEALLSEGYTQLCRLMISTVTHPSQDGVGIAAPQVGLNRRVVAVQRFDKEGEPFEVYPNIRIVWASDSLAVGSEGCLSIPNRREEVKRSQEIEIEYTAVPSSSENVELPLPKVRETISGFTAVIFQHEVDHLNGILYTDRIFQIQ